MDEERKKSGQFVVPGERLGVIEEFTPGPGTYTEQGVVYSKIVGCALLDMPNKKVSVYPLMHAVSVPRMGSIVTGQVSDVQGKRATLRIFKIGEKVLTGFFSGILHVSEASPRYVETMFDVCKTGDIMRAEVISEKNRTYHLSTADNDLGVILAFCSACGHALTFTKQNMQCAKCGKVEMRKVASDYGKWDTEG
jgi:exosome complex component CSL4